LANTSLTIRPFQPDDAAIFVRLNQRWIEAYFGMEEEDRRVLSSPKEAIIDQGGYIAMALLGDEVVGTGALMMSVGHPGVMELVKMATDPNAQGRGVASAVIDHLVPVARGKHAGQIWLETNDKLKAATALYKRKGFRALEAEELHPTPYSRCNLQMVLDL